MFNNLKMSSRGRQQCSLLRFYIETLGVKEQIFPDNSVIQYICRNPKNTMPGSNKKRKTFTCLTWR